LLTQLKKEQGEVIEDHELAINRSNC